MNAEIVAIGSELLLGQIVDSNSAWISEKLADSGINLFFKTIVGDNPDRMEQILRESFERADVVITSGGIGPTKDDLTREIVAKVTDRDVVVDEESLKEIEERFRKRGFIPTKNNDRQAMVPAGSIVVKNPNGTAPAFIVEKGNKCIIALPGVPFEMKWLVDNEIIPYLRKKYSLDETIHYKVLKTIDLGESNVDHLIGDLIENSINPTVGVLAHPGQVDVRIAAKAKSISEANELILPVKEKIVALLGENIFGEDEDTMEKCVGDLLESKKLSISTIENISGGTISEVFQIASESRFKQGIIISNEESLKNISKLTTIKLGKDDPEKYALDQAKIVKEISGSDIGLSYFGDITDDTDVENLGRGESYFAIVNDSRYDIKHVRSAGKGKPDKRRAAMHALSLVRKFTSTNL